MIGPDDLLDRVIRERDRSVGIAAAAITAREAAERTATEALDEVERLADEVRRTTQTAEDLLALLRQVREDLRALARGSWFQRGLRGAIGDLADRIERQTSVIGSEEVQSMPGWPEIGTGDDRRSEQPRAEED